MARIKEDQTREHRIMMEIVVDAYDETERAMGWYYYLERGVKDRSGIMLHRAHRKAGRCPLPGRL